MDRITKFTSLANHPMLGKSHKKLKIDDLLYCKDFLTNNGSLDKNLYATKVLRLWLDKPIKPKAWKEMEELLIACL